MNKKNKSPTPCVKHWQNYQKTMSDDVKKDFALGVKIGFVGVSFLVLSFILTIYSIMEK